MVPLGTSFDRIRAFLLETSGAKFGSFLAALKRSGRQDGPSSFPVPFYMLALGLSINRRPLTLVQKLDEISIAHQERFYLAMDSMMTVATLRQSAPRTDSLTKIQTTIGSTTRFSFL
ncbi:hypothetical protein [Vannielia sp. SX4]|uniref:hypothetical protein n=1 Tax=Vannielia sp. SX4 TaxID=3463852 RepID=UPI004058FF2A